MLGGGPFPSSLYTQVLGRAAPLAPKFFLTSDFFFNHVCERVFLFFSFFRYTREEVLGRNCRFLQGPSTDMRAVKEIRNAIKEGSECTVGGPAACFAFNITFLRIHQGGRAFDVANPVCSYMIT